MTSAVPADHAAANQPSGQPSGQIASLDGIRGLAVGLVVWFHLRADQLPGGWVGMSVFFPLSGFLITRLILIEHGATNSIVLRHFWNRRARRLLPAHYVLLIAVAILLLIGGTWQRSDIGAALSSMFYVNNWWQLSHSVDYFSQFSTGLPPFEHLWSLSVEEQFYIVWPLLTVAVTKWARRPLAVLGLLSCGLAAFGVAYGFAISQFSWGGTSNIYYNTAVRGAELLTGSALAVLFVARPTAWSTERTRKAIDAAACACLIMLFYLALVLGPSAPRFIANGGMFIAGLASIVVIVAAIRGGTVATVLSFAPLRWLGTRCYSLYLWHWPIIALVTRQSSGLSRWWLTSFQTALILATTVLSFWLVEEPLRRRRPGKPRVLAIA